MPPLAPASRHSLTPTGARTRRHHTAPLYRILPSLHTLPPFSSPLSMDRIKGAASSKVKGTTRWDAVKTS